MGLWAESMAMGRLQMELLVVELRGLGTRTTDLDFGTFCRYEVQGPLI
jgi:hypothetical protein